MIFGKNDVLINGNFDIRSDGTNIAYRQGGVQILRHSGDSTILASKKMIYLRPNGHTDPNGQLIIFSDGKMQKNNNEKLYGFKKLYSNSSGTTGTVTLSESSANFDYLMIFFKNTQGSINYDSSIVSIPNGKIVNLNCIIKDLTQEVMFFMSKQIKIAGTSITVSGKGQSHMFANSVNNCSNDNSIAIVEVIGLT